MNSLPLRLSRCSVDIGCRASQVRMTSPTRRSARRIPTSIKLNRPVDPRLFFLLTALFTQTFSLGIFLVHSRHIPANNAPADPQHHTSTGGPRHGAHRQTCRADRNRHTAEHRSMFSGRSHHYTFASQLD